MPYNARVKKLKKRMFKESPYCRFCGVEMFLPTGQLPKKQSRECMATIDHKYSRLDVRRKTAPDEEKRYVLICSLCNCYKAQVEESKMPIEEIWERSNAYPMWHPMSILKNKQVNGNPV